MAERLRAFFMQAEGAAAPFRNRREGLFYDPGVSQQPDSGYGRPEPRSAVHLTARNGMYYINTNIKSYKWMYFSLFGSACFHHARVSAVRFAAPARAKETEILFYGAGPAGILQGGSHDF